MLERSRLLELTSSFSPEDDSRIEAISSTVVNFNSKPNKPFLLVSV